VAKLRLELREGVVLEGDFRGLATELATTQRKGRNRAKICDPTGSLLDVDVELPVVVIAA
jgi:hypothetical protein